MVEFELTPEMLEKYDKFEITIETPTIVLKLEEQGGNSYESGSYKYGE